MTRTAAPLASCVAALFLAACGLAEVDEPPLYGFEGAFQPDSPELPVSGNVAALTQLGSTRISLSAAGLEPETSYAWGMRLGACEGEGDTVVEPAAVPLLESDETGSTAVDPPVQLGIQLDGSATYSVEIFDRSDPEDQRVACADMVRTI